LLRNQQLRLAAVTSIWKVIGSAAIMGVVVYLIRGWPLIIVVLIAVAVYTVALLGTRALDAEELAIVRSGFTGR
jgi:hypothetical protein